MSRNLFKKTFDDNLTKNGFTEAGDVLKREFFSLLRLNMLLLTGALLVVTLPAALTATCRILVLMIQNEEYQLVPEFWACLKREFIKSFGGTLIYLSLLLAALFSGLFYALNFGGSFSGMVLVLIGAFIIIVILASMVYFFILNAVAVLSFINTLKNAFLLALIKLGSNFIYLLAVSFIIIAHGVFWPFSLALVFISPVFMLLLLTANAYENIKILVFADKENDDE